MIYMNNAMKPSKLYISALRNDFLIKSKEETSRPQINSLMIPTQEGSYILPFNDILRVEASSNYCTVHTKIGLKLLVSKTLKIIQNKLPQSEFFRIHQSHVIRLNEIIMVGKREVRLRNDETLPISRNHYPLLMNKLESLVSKI